MQENSELSNIIKRHRGEPGCLIPLLGEIQRDSGLYKNLKERKYV